MLVPFKKFNKWGYSTLNKTIVIDCIYDEALTFIGNIAPVRIKSKWGLINDDGYTIIKCQYDKIHFIAEGLIEVSIIDNRNNNNSRTNKYGLLDKAGNEILPCTSGIIYRRSDEYLYINRGKECLINKYGKIVLNFLYDRSGLSNEDMIPVAMTDERRHHSHNAAFGIGEFDFFGKWGYVNSIGKMVIPLQFSDCKSFAEGLAPVAIEVDYKINWGFIDFKGNNVISFDYEDAIPFSEGLAGVKKNNKWGFIDKYGIVQIPFIYDSVEHFKNGFAKIGIGEFATTDYYNQFLGQYGIIDKHGKLIIDCKYEILESYNQPVILVAKGVWQYDGSGLGEYVFTGKYGFINKEGENITPIIYDFATSFLNEYAIVGLGKTLFHGPKRLMGKFGIINRDGLQTTPFLYDSLEAFPESLFRFENGNWDIEYGFENLTIKNSGIIDYKGQHLTHPSYKYVAKPSEGMVAVSIKSKWGFVETSSMTLVIPCKYDKVSKFQAGLAQVELTGKTFYINKIGTEYIEQ